MMLQNKSYLGGTTCDYLGIHLYSLASHWFVASCLLSKPNSSLNEANASVAAVTVAKNAATTERKSCSGNSGPVYDLFWLLV